MSMLSAAPTATTQMKTPTGEPGRIARVADGRQPGMMEHAAATARPHGGAFDVVACCVAQ
jgi:hypothetical protein